MSQKEPRIPARFTMGSASRKACSARERSVDSVNRMGIGIAVCQAQGADGCLESIWAGNARRDRRLISVLYCCATRVEGGGSHHPHAGAYAGPEEVRIGLWANATEPDPGRNSAVSVHRTGQGASPCLSGHRHPELRSRTKAHRATPAAAGRPSIRDSLKRITLGVCRQSKCLMERAL